MKKFILFFVILAHSFMAIAANIGDDNVYIGQRGSTGDKFLIFRDANSSHISVDHTNGYFLFGDGDNTANKRIVFDIGLGASNPFFEWDFTKGKIRFSNDGSGVKDIGSGSGAGGGENFNNGFTADDNANAEDGTTGWTASAGVFAATSTDPLEGDQSFEWTPAAQNDTLDSPVLDFNKDILKGRACQASIEYIGGDDNLSLKVINGDNEELGSLELPAHSISAVESVFFLCPTDAQIVADADKGNLRLRIENTGASASPLVKFDKSYLGTLIGLSESTLPDVLTVDIENNGSITIGDSNGGTWWDSITRTGTGVVVVNYASLSLSSIPTVVGQIKNQQTRIISADSVSTTSATFSIRTTSNVNEDLDFNIILVKQGSDAKQSVQVYKSIPKTSEIKNEFSASFDGSSSSGTNPVTVTSESVPGAITCTRVTTGSYDCDVSSLNLSSLPGVQCTVSQNEGGAGTRNCTVRNKTVNDFDVNINVSTTAAFEDRDFDLIVTKHDDDFKTPQVKNISLAGIAVNSYAEDSQKQVRTEACYVENSGIPTSASDLCDSWIDSIDDNGTGEWNLNVISGTFSGPPICTCVSTGNADCARLGSTSSDDINFRTRDSSNTQIDTDVYLICVGKK